MVAQQCTCLLALRILAYLDAQPVRQSVGILRHLSSHPSGYIPAMTVTHAAREAVASRQGVFVHTAMAVRLRGVVCLLAIQ